MRHILHFLFYSQLCIYILYMQHFSLLKLHTEGQIVGKDTDKEKLVIVTPAICLYDN